MSEPTGAAVSERTGAWTALHDPATTAAQLAQIAESHPDFAERIARHPNAYPALVEWATGRQADVAGVAAVPARAGSAPLPPQPWPAGHSPARPKGATGWIVVAAILVAVGAARWLIDLASPQGRFYLNPLLALALDVAPYAATLVVALVVAPSPGRKTGAAVLAAFGAFVAVFGESRLMPLLAVGAIVFLLVSHVALFVAWALARPIRGLGYLALIPLPVLLIGERLIVIDAFDRAYSSGSDLMVGVWSFVFPVVVYPAILIGTAVLSIALSRVSERRNASRPPLVHPAPGGYAHPFGAVGARPDGFPVATPYGGVGYGGAPQAGYAYPARTNTMAVLSLVFAFVFSPLAIVFGHVGLSQLRLTGEQGRGLAIAGLVLGYISVGAAAIAILAYLMMIV